MKLFCRHRNVATSSINGDVLCQDCGRRVPHPWGPPPKRQWRPLVFHKGSRQDKRQEVAALERLATLPGKSRMRAEIDQSTNE
jgi:hypothetical protein